MYNAIRTTGGRIIRGAMEIDAEKLKDALRFMFENVKQLEMELLAYRAAIVLTQVAGLTSDIPWGETLESARTNPALVKMISDKYDRIVTDLMQSIDAADLQIKILALLRQWKPSGKPN